MYKHKSLYCITKDTGRIQTRLIYNINTNHITINNSFSVSKSNYEQKPINKDSAQYLGITCAEQVLGQIFKNVEMMPFGNKGFDFICGKGYKVDSKASVIRNKKYWSFSINKNKIADYFALLIFDNRDNINPLHFWLIPGDIVNDKITLTISKSTITKWDEYKQDINKVIKCCNNIKGR